MLVVLFACDPAVPIPRREAPAAASAGEGGAAVALEPSAPLDAAPTVLRLRVAAEVALEPEDVLLVHGHVGPAHLRQLQRREISASLAEREVPALVYREAPAEKAAGSASMVVAPTAVLAPGESYALMIGELSQIVELKVAAPDPVPLLERIWPPAGGSATAGFGVWCGSAELVQVDAPVQLSPEGRRGRMRRGVVGEDVGRRCIRFESLPSEVAEEGVPPPVLPGLEAIGRLDPRPLRVDADAHPIAPVLCAVGELAFGPGCVTVFDDRLTGRSPEAPVLWAVQGEGMDRVFATAGEAFVVAPLPANAAISLRVATVDNRGEASDAIFSATTLPPMPHLVLNEVLANPIGPEPAQEWVEIINDGAVPAELGGYMLADVGGETPIPAATLEPGSFALIVNEAFIEDDGYDPRPAPSALILRVPRLGQSGLSNAGEPLTLRDPDGNAVSRFPAGLKAKAGLSVARSDPGAPDALLQAFTAGAPTPGQPNEP